MQAQGYIRGRKGDVKHRRRADIAVDAQSSTATLRTYVQRLQHPEPTSRYRNRVATHFGACREAGITLDRASKF
jgi:hypothetical protein